MLEWDADVVNVRFVYQFVDAMNREHDEIR